MLHANSGCPFLSSLFVPISSSMYMSPVHQVCPKPSCKAQWKGEEEKAVRRADNFREWTALEFAKSLMTVEKEKCRKLIVKSFVVSQRPSRLWDMWRWRRRNSKLIESVRMIAGVYCLPLLESRWDTADAEIMVLSFKHRGRINYSLACFIYCQQFYLSNLCLSRSSNSILSQSSAYITCLVMSTVNRTFTCDLTTCFALNMSSKK